MFAGLPESVAAGRFASFSAAVSSTLLYFAKDKDGTDWSHTVKYVLKNPNPALGDPFSVGWTPPRQSTKPVSGLRDEK